jgi:hypothetical protein
MGVAEPEQGVQAIHDVCWGTYIVILGETEELANLRSTLGTKTLGVNDISNAGDIIVALLDDGESENRKIHSNDAATNRLALALTSAARTVAGMAFGEEESDTSGMHNTLLHGETLLVVATGDLENVALELITNAVAWDLGAHSAGIVRLRPSSVCVFERVSYLLSMKTRNFLSSSTSISFWLPLAGCCGRQLMYFRGGGMEIFERKRTKEIFYQSQKTLAYIFNSINGSENTHQLHLDGVTGSRSWLKCCCRGVLVVINSSWKSRRFLCGRSIR